jgi:hypothetical protein
VRPPPPASRRGAHIVPTPVIHCIRIAGIYGQSRPLLYALGALAGAQAVVTAVCCAFYQGRPIVLRGEGRG